MKEVSDPKLDGRREADRTEGSAMGTLTEIARVFWAQETIDTRLVAQRLNQRANEGLAFECVLYYGLIDRVIVLYRVGNTPIPDGVEK